MLNFQEMIAQLTQFWAEQGCLVHQGYDLEVGAGTFNPATFLRCLGPEPYKAVYVEPSRRPQDGRYGENPNRVQFYHQMQVILKPSPHNLQDLYLQSLKRVGLDLTKHDIRFVHDDWENPTIGAWGLGWEVWADGMEVTQYTYFQAVGGHPVKPVSGELTYGLERLAMYIQGVDSFFDLKLNDTIYYGDVYKRSEWEWSHYNFTEADTALWHRHFEDFEAEAKRLVRAHLPIPAYDFVMKASHAFNLLDARGVISVTERTGYIGRIRNLAKLLADAYLKSREEQEFPLLKETLDSSRPTPPPPSQKCDPKETQDFLFEIGSEELPALFVPIGVAQLEHHIQALLSEHALSYESLETYGTPRRLAVLVKGLAGGTAPKSVERKGPALKSAFDTDGTPTKAGAGFLRSLNVEEVTLQQVEKGQVKNLEIRNLKGTNYLFAQVDVPGTSTRALLAERLPKLVLKLEFPKKMRWGNLDIEYPRPLRWFVALYGKEILPFELAGTLSDRLTFGHRTLAPKPLSLAHASDYLATLRKAHVMASISERKASILEQLKEIEARIGGKAFAVERVLAQTLHLVEWPFLTESTFDPNFLVAPKEVLTSEMIEHQKYFPVVDASGDLLPSFIIVCHLPPTDLIRHGNQKALSPRLADGMFLYEEDLKTPLEGFNTKLKAITFQKDVGSVWGKVERLLKYVDLLFYHLPICELPCLQRAAHLAKADLATELVGEFPELQGSIGKVYALKSGENEAVATAIDEHWMPRGEKAPLPKTPCGVLLSIADKIDNLLSCFSLDLKPTSSSDPYALRRQGMGILKMLIERELHLPLSSVLGEAFDHFVAHPELNHKRAEKIHQDKNIHLADLETFLMGRLRTLLVDEGFGKDEIEAVLAEGLKDCYACYRRLKALQTFRKENHTSFLALLELYTRTRKILLSQKDWNPETPFNPALAQETSERTLFKKVEEVQEQFHTVHVDRRDPTQHNYLAALKLFSELKGPIEALFEEVKIIDSNKEIRFNHLALLQQILDLSHELCDFSKLQEHDIKS